MACQLVIVKGVHRLSVLFHDIIGDVHDIIDGTDTAGCQTALHPLGRGSKLYILYHPGAVTGTQPAVLHPHIQVVVDVLTITRWCDHRGMECLSKGGGSLSGHADYAVAVHAVGCDFILEHHVPQPHDFHCVGAGHAVLRKNVDTALRGVRVHIPAGAQFLHGAHHTAGLHAS